MKASSALSIIYGVYDISNLDLGWGLSKIGAGLGVYRLASFVYPPESDFFGYGETTSSDGNIGW